MKKKRITFNLIFSIINFVVTLAINFFLSRYIVNTIGTEANGFITLANNFIAYASIATVAINSMAGRFITINIHQNKKEEANKYFNSILIANLFLSCILFILIFLAIWQLENLINIPYNIINDVKILFVFVFTSFILTTVFTVFSSSTFASNRLDLQYRRQTESNILKALLLLLLFYIFKPSITFVGFATLISTVFIIYYNIKYTKKLLPEIKINKSSFDFKKIKEVFFAGIWNTITNLGNVLFEGLDLLISNLFIGPLAMGRIALSKIITSIFATLLSTVANVFNPQLTIDYAKHSVDKLIEDLKTSMKMSGFISNISLSILIVFGLIFYNLWIPTEDTNLIYKLTLLSTQGVIISGIITPMWYTYTITNKLKGNSLIVLGTSIISLGITVLLLKTTNLGLYAIAGTSTTINIIRNLTITPTYTAHCLGVKKTTFYPLIFRYVGVTGLLVTIFMLIKTIIMPTTWIMLVVSIIICGAIGAIINFFILLNKNERMNLLDIVKNRRVLANE